MDDGWEDRRVGLGRIASSRLAIDWRGWARGWSYWLLNVTLTELRGEKYVIRFRGVLVGRTEGPSFGKGRIYRRDARHRYLYFRNPGDAKDAQRLLRIVPSGV